MRAIIKECIERLRRFSELDKNMARHFKLRARVVAECLEHYFAEDNLDNCRTIIFLEADNLFEHCGNFWFEQDYSGRSSNPGQYPVIISEIYRKLMLCWRDSVAQSGVKIIHRIWLGRNLTGDEIKRIMACNQYFSKIWKSTGSEQAQPLRTILWTNNKHLLASDKLSTDIEIKDYRELVDADRRFSQYIESFIHHGEYAYASDILRYLAIYLYGGLHLSIYWTRQELSTDWSRCCKVFEPTKNTIKVSFYRIGGVTMFSWVFMLTSNGEFLNKSIDTPLEEPIDSEIMYTGIKYSPFIRYNLEVLYAFLNSQYMVSKDGKVVRNSRATRGQAAKSKNYEETLEFFQIILHSAANLNIGLTITNNYPLITTLAHMGMLMMIYSPAVRYASLNKKYGIEMRNIEEAFKNIVIYIGEFGISRQISQSWKKISRAYNPNSEV